MEYKKIKKDIEVLSINHSYREIFDGVLKKMYEGDILCLSNKHPALKRALRYLTSNFTDHIAMKDIASYACVSPPHLSYLFKAYCGVTIRNIVNGLRIHESMNLIKKNKYISITEVSIEVGYLDLGHYEKMFKRFVGVTPSQFKKTLN